MLELGRIEALLLGGQVHGLAAGDAVRAAGLAQQGHEPDLRLGLAGQRRRRGEHLEGERLQRVGGEDGGRLVEGPVGGRAAAAHVVVVHGRQVVVDQREGMHQLDGDRRRVEAVGIHLAAPRPVA